MYTHTHTLYTLLPSQYGAPRTHSTNTLTHTHTHMHAHMCVFAIPLYHKPICRYLSFADTFAVYLGTTSLATNLLAMFALGEKVDGT